MDEISSRIWEDLVGRIHGPLSFRFFLQPAMAIILALRDGIRDARNGEPAYFWSLFTDSTRRRDRIRSGWKGIARVFVLGVIMDVIYQLLELHRLYPGEALIVATALAIVPYVLLRGPVNRVAQHWTHGRLLSKPIH